MLRISDAVLGLTVLAFANRSYLHERERERERERWKEDEGSKRLGVGFAHARRGARRLSARA